jgi:carboxypeptidase Taq
MGEKYQQLVKHLGEIRNLGTVGGLLGWDQQVMMPAGAAPVRAAQMAILSRITHEMLTGDETARLLEEAEGEMAGADYDSDEASMIRVAKRDYENATKLPSEFVAELARVRALAHEVWAQARANNNFRTFQPTLERILELKQQEAEYRGYDEHPYDALLGQFERGMVASQVKTIFDEHKPPLVNLIAALKGKRDRVTNNVLHQHYDIDKQRQFALDIVKAFGFDFERGRQDVAVHPFCAGFARGDVRITTRFYEDFLNPSLFGMMHEAGHGMYEQGIPERLDGTILGTGTSLAVHESQSRMWENVVGRSRGFWGWAFPQLKALFPVQLARVDIDSFYRAINTVQPSFIRVEADEATYNLHIMLRFELEMDMVVGKVKVSDLPEEWNDRFEAYIGIEPPNDKEGVLQDVHWSSGLVGYFATYALGNMLAAQYYRKAILDRPGIPDDIANGKFDSLLTWLNENIHQYGRKFTSDELTHRLTGEGIQSRYYMEYLEKKYSDIYGL